MSKSSETSIDRTVAPKQLLALLKDRHQQKTKISTIAGELGERVKNAVENGHLHRGAFGVAYKLYAMEEQKREDFIRQLNLYVDICREGGLFGPEHAGDLDRMAREAEAGEGEAEPLNVIGARALAKGLKQFDPDKAKGTVKGTGALEGGEAVGSYREVHTRSN